MIRYQLTPQQLREISALAMSDIKTVRQAYVDPSKLRNTSLVRIARAAKQLGAPLPSGCEAGAR